MPKKLWKNGRIEDWSTGLENPRIFFLNFGLFDIPLRPACLREVPPSRDEGRDFEI
jgi:hypothetical protein